MTRYRPIAERLQNKTQQQGDCLVWTGTKNRHGYGYISDKSKMRIVHRVAYELAYGKIPDGFDILHSCDNPSCVNPDHLRAGTHTDNMREMFAKGRNRTFSGEQSSQAKLTVNDIHAIRQRYDEDKANGRNSLKRIAADYGVHFSLISLIVRREIWRNV